MTFEIEDIYNALLDSGLSEVEINSLFKKKLNEYGDHMSHSGLYFLIAKDLGLSIQEIEMDGFEHEFDEDDFDYDDFTIKISEVEENLSDIVLLGRIERVYNTREFQRQDGSPGVVGSFVLSDGSGTIKVVLWDEQVEIMQNEFFRSNEVVRVIFGYSKVGKFDPLEVHLTRKGKVILAPKDVNPDKIPFIDLSNLSPNLSSNFSNHEAESISSLYNKEGYSKKIEGVVAYIEYFKQIDKKDGDKTYLLRFILSDAESKIYVNFWGSLAESTFKTFNVGDLVTLSSVAIKNNSFTNQKELSSTRYTTIQVS